MRRRAGLWVTRRQMRSCAARTASRGFIRSRMRSETRYTVAVMSINRREFGELAVTGLVSAGILRSAGKIPIAVQIYSVRQIAEKDLAGVLAQIAKLGYQGVEFAGYYGHGAPAIRKMLDDTGLKAAGTHIPLETLLGDNLPKTTEFNRTIGNKNLIVPGLAPKYHSSIAAWKDT